MPFTPLHLGPALLFGLLLYRYLDFVSLAFASIAVDFRAILVFFNLLDGPLHGSLHTLAGALTIGLVVSGITYYTREDLNQILQHLKLDQERNKWKILGGGLIGALLHLLLDAFLYSDVEPLYPFMLSNPFQGAVSVTGIYGFTALCLLAGFIYYLYFVYRQID